MTQEKLHDLRQEDLNEEFIQACRYGELEKAKEYIEAGADVKAKDKNKNTALHLAGFCGHTEVVKLLIEKDSPINNKNKYGAAPLHYAVCHFYTEIVKLLIEAGANINIKDGDGKTALYYAELRKDCELPENDEIIALLQQALNKEAGA